MEENQNRNKSLVSLGYKEEFANKDLVVEGAETDIYLATSEYPRSIGGFGFCICVEGECEIILDRKAYVLKKGDLCSVFPDTILQTIHKSADFKAYIIATEIDVLPLLALPSSTEIFLFMKENPCIFISETEQETILNLCKQTQGFVSYKTHPYKRQLIEHSVLLICFEIAGIYQLREPIAKKEFSRKDFVFRNFIYSLSKNYKEHRNVAFYAEEQCLSVRYFSSIIKEMSGKSVLDNIVEYVLINAKILIGSTQKSIQEIAEELNFSNASFFGTYFKRYTGMTPLEYRKTEGHTIEEKSL